MMQGSNEGLPRRDEEDAYGVAPNPGLTVSNALYHLADGAQISTQIQSLIAVCLIHYFSVSKYYGKEASAKTQETWLGIAVIATAFLSTILIKIYNARKSTYPAVQDYVYSIFSSANIYFLIDLLSKKGKEMPWGWFIAISCVCLPLAALFYLELALVDSSNRLIYKLRHLNELNPPKFSDESMVIRDGLNISKFVRGLNALTGVNYLSESLAAFLWVVIREVKGKTEETPMYLNGMAALFLLIAAKIGYEMTDHPKFFQGFVACCRLLKSGSLAYAAISGIFFVVVKYSLHCPVNKFCASDTTKMALSYLTFFMSLLIGSFAFATTRFKAQENYDGSIKLIGRVIQEAKVEPGSAMLFCKTGFWNAIERIKKCCACCTSSEAERESLVGTHTSAV